MTINLSEVEFTSDYWEIEAENGNTLILNKIDEEFVMDINDVTYVTKVKRINIFLLPEGEEKQTVCSGIIGVKDKYVTVISDYPELQGKLLTEDNMAYCSILVED